ncbi:lauroyl acyltransferase [Anopheles sinensis]|uniref:Lauroyl acyltransferase n=1 Tax=Anopheles sinensis TaxID=74873 RepID=A0A084VM10_ANOSI|nr:lauroyl acyltransferase [Anopheles sinensis]
MTGRSGQMAAITGTLDSSSVSARNTDRWSFLRPFAIGNHLKKRSTSAREQEDVVLMDAAEARHRESPASQHDLQTRAAGSLRWGA